MATLADDAFRPAGSLLAIAGGRHAGIFGSETTPPCGHPSKGGELLTLEFR